MHETRTSLISIHPVLAVEDLAVAIAYYRDKLGFSLTWQWDDPPTRAGVARDSVEIQLLSDSELRPGSPGQVYCVMTGLDDYYRECEKRGAMIKSELGMRPWGMKDFRILDPSGNQLGFGEIA